MASEGDHTPSGTEPVWGRYDPIQEQEYDVFDEACDSAPGSVHGLSQTPLPELSTLELRAEEESEDEYAARFQNLEELDEDPDADIDKDGGAHHGPMTSKEKRAAQNAVFRAFALRKEAQITDKEVKEVLQEIEDDKLSIKQLLKKQETSSIIASPRDYQTELFQRAKDDNIIAVLGTGSGKTHIATLLLRHILDLELDARKKGQPPKISFFLVNSVNLVFQQSNVLDCGLGGHAVEGISGSMGPSLWNKQTWQRHLDKNMVIVCTAQVLVDCMMHSFINMTKVNLLIFDEAHHAKSDHPYARLMKDYYFAISDHSQRPRVFGMTASPVDANTDIKDAAVQLEAMLDCKIATTSDITLAANAINRPEEEIARYPRLPGGYETKLHQELKSHFGHLSVFGKLFNQSKRFASELGRWASDEYWTFAFTEAESRKREIREEYKFNKTLANESVEKLNTQIAQLREAAEYVKNFDNGIPTLSPEDLSSKVLLLHWYLDQYYHRHGNNRCIVFVEQRQTARLLHRIFKYIGGPHLHGDILVGVSGSIGDFNVSLSKQVRTVSDFRKGELNCIFSTSVAEEGLDIPQCNLVARFDLYRTMIGYVQSRGRARHQNSRYLHMIELDNAQQEALIFEAMSAEQRMKSFCLGLSGDRLLDDADTRLPQLLLAENNLPFYQDPITGARLTYSSSLSILGYFVACLPKGNEQVDLQPTYVTSRAVNTNPNGMNESGWQCEVILPENSPITFKTGRVHRKKAVAKCSAAFEMCLELRQKGYLDENLLSTMKKTAPAGANAQLAVSEKKKNLYPMRVKPEIWQIGLGNVPKVLYLTTVDMDAGLDRPHQGLGLLTRMPLPQFPKFPIYLKDDETSHVIMVPLSKPVEVTAETLGLFTSYFHHVYEDIFHKDFETDPIKMYYWQVPLRRLEAPITASTAPEDVIDMAQVRSVCAKPEYRWTPEMPAELLPDKYIVDRGAGGRRFYSIRVMPNLKPLDPVPVNVPAWKWNDNILDYSVSLWKKDRARRKWDENQPVMEVEKIGHRRNWLAVVDSKDDEEVKEIKGKNIAYLCPEPLRVSAVSELHETTLESTYVLLSCLFPLWPCATCFQQSFIEWKIT